VGMPNPALRASQRPDELTGGLRQRAVIASAIALQPWLLIADEPTTALDTTVQAGILDLLERLRDEGAAVLLISHDLAVVSRLASQVLVMSEGRVVESGPTHSVLSAPQHPYTRRLIAAVPAGRPRFSRLTEEPRALEMPMESIVEPVVVLAATGLSRRFDTLQAVDDVSFSLQRGRTLGIVGESGSGKTTLARLVLALERPDTGHVSLLGEPWSGVPESARRARRARIGAIYQDAVSSFDPRWTVGRILADALGGTEGVPALLKSVGLTPALAARRPRHLSGGQQQRVAIARALSQQPRLVLADEPVASLDPPTAHGVMGDLRRINQELGITVITNLHLVDLARQYGTRLIGLRAGEVVYDGAVADATDAVFEKIYGRSIENRDVLGA
jgi:peptide/nickel transport system ATP-binding protein